MLAIDVIGEILDSAVLFRIDTFDVTAALVYAWLVGAVLQRLLVDHVFDGGGGLAQAKQQAHPIRCAGMLRLCNPEAIDAYWALTGARPSSTSDGLVAHGT